MKRHPGAYCVSANFLNEFLLEEVVLMRNLLMGAYVYRLISSILHCIQDTQKTLVFPHYTVYSYVIN